MTHPLQVKRKWLTDHFSPSDDVRLSDQEWEKLAHLVAVLSIPKKATIAIQREDMTPGECLLEWREAVFRLQKLGGDLALEIARCIKAREQRLFESKIFEAAIWIDPRARVLLEDGQKETAKATLHSLFLRHESASAPEDNAAQVKERERERE